MDTIGLFRDGLFDTDFVARTSGDGRVGFIIGPIGFTQGVDILPTGALPSLGYQDAGGNQGGALSSALNYSRWDMDNNGVYETVIELSLGASAGITDDSITRYFYDDTGADLNIAPAVAAGSTAAVPEPSSFAILGLGLAGFGIRRFRRKEKQAAA